MNLYGDNAAWNRPDMPWTEVYETQLKGGAGSLSEMRKKRYDAKKAEEEKHQRLLNQFVLMMPEMIEARNFSINDLYRIIYEEYQSHTYSNLYKEMEEGGRLRAFMEKAGFDVRMHYYKDDTGKDKKLLWITYKGESTYEKLEKRKLRILEEATRMVEEIEAQQDSLKQWMASEPGSDFTQHRIPGL